MVFFRAAVRSDFVVLLAWSFSALFPVQSSVGRGDGDYCWLLVEVMGTAACW